MNWREGRRYTAAVSQRSGNGTIIEKIGTNTTIYHKQSSAGEVAGLEIKTCVTMGEFNQVAVVLVALQEATSPLVLVVDLAVVDTNQYLSGGNVTGNQCGYDCDLSHFHCTIFKMMEPHYIKFRGTIHLNNLVEAGGIAHNNGTLPWLKRHWRNNKSMICWHNMLICC